MGTERLLKRAIFTMYKDRQEGDMLMDAPACGSWYELCAYAMDRDYWRARVRALRQPRLRIEGSEIMKGECKLFAISS